MNLIPLTREKSFYKSVFCKREMNKMLCTRGTPMGAIRIHDDEKR